MAKVQIKYKKRTSFCKIFFNKKCENLCLD